MDIIWNQDNFMEARRSPLTLPLATMPFISAHVSLRQQSGCAIDLEGLGIRQRQKRLFNLEASDNLYETGVFFRFHRLHWVWNLVQVEPDLSKEPCEEQEVEMDIIWNQDNFMEARRSPLTLPLATMPFISAHVSLRQQSGCAIDLEGLGIRQRQKKTCLFSTRQITCMRRVFFSIFIGCTEFGIWFKQNQIFQKKHVRSRNWRWTSYGIKIISWRLGGRHSHCH